MKPGVALLLTLSMLAGDASGCSCPGVAVEELLDEAQVVALVRVRKVELDPQWQARRKSADRVLPLRAEVDVIETLRGAPAPVLQVASGYGNGDCGLRLMPGEDVLLAASPHAGGFELHFCSASRALGMGSLLEASGDPAPRSLDRLYLHAVRDYLSHGTRIHACLRGGVPPPPPPPDAADAGAYPDCAALLRASPSAAD